MPETNSEYPFKAPGNRALVISQSERSTTRDRSGSLPLPLSEKKRNHSVSVSSVQSNMSDCYEPYDLKFSREVVDLEKLLIISAGSRKESVMCYVFKILFLTTVVFGCGVLVFYAL